MGRAARANAARRLRTRDLTREQRALLGTIQGFDARLANTRAIDTALTERHTTRK